MKLSTLALFGLFHVAIADDLIVRTVIPTAVSLPAVVKDEIVSGMEMVQVHVEETLAEISGNNRALLGTDWFDSKLVKVKELFALVELTTPSDPDHRVLRGQQHRELPAEPCTAPYTNCENWCCGYAFGRCYTAYPNDNIVFATCGGWRELKVLTEEEVEQLGEDERHRHLSTAATCAESIAAVRESIKHELEADAYALIKDKLVHNCFIVSPP